MDDQNISPLGKAQERRVTTKYQVQIQYLVQRYRYKHRDDRKALDALERILWYSYPVVYPNWETSQRDAQRLINARRQAKKRANRYITEMAQTQERLAFVTLTFRDDVLASTSERTRHRYVSAFLKASYRDYIANVDYGSKSGREHYHAVVALDPESPPLEWQYGFINAKNISVTPENRSKQRLSSYLLKLSNHAGKPSAGRIFHAKGLREVDALPF